ncbi:MAG TPA: aldehyde dehydrogenase (NADP(+)) [Jiangellaceae bacterium]|nr:aldehyde dehydrogenase (NADP(+)) [Jiangellaceae bacterium]
MTAEVDKIVRAAGAAAPALDGLGRVRRATLLDSLADALEGARSAIVATADSETGLGASRLSQELTRTCYQLRLFGEILREGSYLEATIDLPAATPMGQRPDLRRMLVPLGPVGVFGASNFPLAFSVPGGDTASALAAGCPVVIKAHPSHPDTSRLCWSTMQDAVAAHWLPAGALGLVHGYDSGAALVRHPAIKAVGFTGSTAGGRALQDLAATRPEPIPFYGELGSLNPLIVTPGAASGQAAEIAQGFVGSMTLGTGQFCTKPGLLFLPSGADGEQLRTALAEAVRQVPAGVMLTPAIQEAFDIEVTRRRTASRLTVLGEGTSGERHPRLGAAVLFAVAASDLDDALLEECFGPTALVVEYGDLDQLIATLGRLPGQLTATVHAAGDEVDTVGRLHDVLRGLAGRLVFDGYPTGVAVSWAMHHGGPHPATTNSGHTSVGAASIRRWLRPISYQNAPSDVLPLELRDENPAGIPRRVNGTLQPSGAEP